MVQGLNPGALAAWLLAAQKMTASCTQRVGAKLAHSTLQDRFYICGAPRAARAQR